MSLRWKIRDRELDLGKRALILGIVNVTPDSFSAGDGGRFADADAAVDFRTHDLGSRRGGPSSTPANRPGPARCPFRFDEELERRVLPVTRRTAAARPDDADLPIEHQQGGSRRGGVDGGGANHQ